MNGRGKAGDRLQTLGLVLINLFKQTQQGEGKKLSVLPPLPSFQKAINRKGAGGQRGGQAVVSPLLMDREPIPHHTTLPLSLSLPLLHLFSFEMECFEDPEGDYMVFRGWGLSKTGSFVSNSRLLTSWPFIPSKQKPNFSVYHSERVWGREGGRAAATKAARKRWVYTLRPVLEQKKGNGVGESIFAHLILICRCLI